MEPVKKLIDIYLYILLYETPIYRASKAPGRARSGHPSRER